MRREKFRNTKNCIQKFSLILIVNILGIVFCNSAWSESLDEYIKKAEQGYPQAQFKLGEKYDEGEGVDENNEKALHLYNKAAEQNHPEGQFNFGVMYEEREGFDRNNEKAIHWYKKAEFGGHHT